MNSYIRYNFLSIFMRCCSPNTSFLVRKMKTILYNNIQFTQIKNFDNYYVSRCGQIYSKIKYKGKGGLLSKQINEKGYLRIGLNVNSKQKHFRVSRLVALTFIPNPKNKPDVDHIDENKTNNNVNNLRWVTRLENMLFRNQNQGHPFKGKFGKSHPKSKKVNQYDLEGNFIKLGIL